VNVIDDDNDDGDGGDDDDDDDVFLTRSNAGCHRRLNSEAVASWSGSGT